MPHKCSLGTDPIADYVLPIRPTIKCYNPARLDSSQGVPSAAFTNYLTAVGRKASQFSTSGLLFTAQCVHAQHPAHTLCKG